MSAVKAPRRTRYIDGKNVSESRWLMEQHLGRKLLPTEHVHHINENPIDNRIENLQILSPNAHMRMHKQIYPDEKTCQWCGKSFIADPRKRKRQKTCGPQCATAMRNHNMSLTKRGISKENANDL